MKARTSTVPETLAQVDQWEKTKRRYLRAGLCHKCAAQAAWATQPGAGGWSLITTLRRLSRLVSSPVSAQSPVADNRPRRLRPQRVVAGLSGVLTPGAHTTRKAPTAPGKVAMHGLPHESGRWTSSSWGQRPTVRSAWSPQLISNRLITCGGTSSDPIRRSRSAIARCSWPTA